ncbi:hypothetical protein EGR_08127 [Echinococcus granulosus]|uniref:Uncharacterized protein n=1 Tax=Echinococcus granulosus TaxID=6210 RepID=W6U912_ECHGR|nr:hypothetical protein EGR_08127 [Echinococcus granulosus]EUB56976.1 hypothetical protein EGR_08127 [Echinococcus granulosus]
MISLNTVDGHDADAAEVDGLKASGSVGRGILMDNSAGEIPSDDDSVVHRDPTVEPQSLTNWLAFFRFYGRPVLCCGVMYFVCLATWLRSFVNIEIEKIAALKLRERVLGGLCTPYFMPPAEALELEKPPL